MNQNAFASLSLGDLIAEYLSGSAQKKFAALLNIPIKSLCNHHETLQSMADKGALKQTAYFALQGQNKHGLQYLSDASLSALPVIIYQAPSGLTPDWLQNLMARAEIAHKLIPVACLNEYLSEISSKFYGAPTKNHTVIAVTGTNGKSSIAQFVAQLTDGCSVGTLGYGYRDLMALEHTTPDALQLQSVLAELHQLYPEKSIAMEISSHALMQHRVKGLDFAVAVFSNLTQDHLDFHGTMENYFATKATLFRDFVIDNAVINVDCPYGQRLFEDLQSDSRQGLELWAYGQSELVKSATNYAHFSDVSLSKDGSVFTLELKQQNQIHRQQIKCSLWGEFNIYNALAALLAGLAIGRSLSDLLEGIGQLTAICGRLSPVYLHSGAVAVVDFAHTPDALRSSLTAARAQMPVNKKLICVFGCGGDRDKDKRPKMAIIAESLADSVVVTDDNPRMEKSIDIINTIMSGVHEHAKFRVIPDRREAISAALALANAGDVVLIAGKGHERYQIIGKARHYFSDFDEIAAHEKAKKQESKIITND